MYNLDFKLATLLHLRHKYMTKQAIVGHQNYPSILAVGYGTGKTQTSYFLMAYPGEGMVNEIDSFQPVEQCICFQSIFNVFLSLLNFHKN